MEYITVNSKVDGSTVLDTIDDPQIVQDMVAMTLAAGLSEAAVPVDSERYFICYHLLDGTEVNRSYWIETGQMAPGIALPQEFADLVRNALND